MTAKYQEFKQSQQHLNEEELHNFVGNPEMEEFSCLRLHIVNCSECREKIELMQSMEVFAREQAHVIAMQPGGELKAKLHEVTHRIAMEASELEKSTQPKEKGLRSSGRFSWLKSLFAVEVNWLVLPATAMASFFAAWMLIAPAKLGSPEHQLVSYRDTQGLVFQQQQLPQPGLGFFHPIDQKMEHYAGFDISLNGESHTVVIKWPAIDGLVAYNLVLNEVSNNVSKSLTSVKTEDTQWDIDQSLLQPGVLYRIHLSGVTTSDLHVQYSGGFVFQ